MVKISWSEHAALCAEHIFDYLYLQSKSEDVARRVVDRIFERAFQLRHFPESGQVEEALKERGLLRRYLVVANYKMIYLYDDKKQEIIITDIFHTSQDPNKLKR